MINKKVVAMKIVFLDAHAACSSMLSDGTAVRHDTTVTVSCCVPLTSDRLGLLPDNGARHLVAFGIQFSTM